MTVIVGCVKKGTEFLLQGFTRVVVLGGGGFIGGRLISRVVRDGGRVLGVGRGAPPSIPSDAFEWLQVSLDAGSFPRLFQEGDTVYFLLGAGIPATSNADIPGDVARTLPILVAALEQACAAGVSRAIFASSGGTVYGPDAPLPTHESAPTDPISSYGILKLAAEKYFALYERNRGLRYTVLRIANPYGPHQRAGRGQGVIAEFMSRAIQSQPIELYGEGATKRDFVHIDDVIDALLAAARYEGLHRVINIGGGTSRALREIVSAIENLRGARVTISHFPARTADAPVSHLDISRAALELSWKPQVDWQTGIRSTYDWFLHQEDPGA